jgi:biotin carboxyl carrier protein
MQSKDAEIVRLVGRPKTCIVKESGGPDGAFDVLSPGIGFIDLPPAVGTFVTPGSFVGYLTVLRRYFHLVIPEGRHGVVTHLHVKTRKQRVEYGEPLFTVSPKAETGLSAEFARVEGETETAEDGVPEGMFGIKSPTDGIFYRRANPQSPAYVEKDAQVSSGTVLALVEVMKCFNPIVYPGEPEFPARARIVRAIPQDATEVKHGDLLFIVEPA